MGLPLFIGRGDVSKAVDELEHPLLDAALAHRQAPLALRAATLRELVGIALEIHLQGVVTDPVPLGKGGKQGGPDTPADWNYLLDFALKDAVTDWLRAGWRRPGGRLPYLARDLGGRHFLLCNFL